MTRSTHLAVFYAHCYLSVREYRHHHHGKVDTSDIGRPDALSSLQAGLTAHIIWVIAVPGPALCFAVKTGSLSSAAEREESM